MKVFTIGFKGRSAEDFLLALKNAGVQKLIDARRKNSSQLAGFTKGPDLRFFLQECLRISYEHIPEFAPSEELLREYQSRVGKTKKNDAAWAYYSERFRCEVLSEQIIERFQKAANDFNVICLLCSEETADRCHRRLLVEHFKRHLPSLQIQHL